MSPTLFAYPEKVTMVASKKQHVLNYLYNTIVITISFAMENKYSYNLFDQAGHVKVFFCMVL